MHKIQQFSTKTNVWYISYIHYIHTHVLYIAENRSYIRPTRIVYTAYCTHETAIPADWPICLFGKGISSISNITTPPPIRVEWCSTFWYFQKRAHCCRSGLFFIFKFLKIVEFGGDHSGRTAKFSFRILVVYFRVIIKIKKLKNIISNLNLGIGGL